MDITFLPGFWQCRQQVNFSSMTLQQHFSDAGCCPKIPIDLKRWMGVEKVRQGGLLQQLDQIIVCFFSIIETGKEIDRSEEHTSELQSRENLVCSLLFDKIKNIINICMK